MAFAHKPYTHLAVYDLSSPANVLSTTDVRNAAPPDIAAPSEYFMGGDGLRTKVRAGTVFSFDIGDQDEIATMLDTMKGLSVRCVALGKARALQWLETVPLEVRQGGLAYDTVRGELHTGLLSPAVYDNADLLKWAGWADADSNNILDNYSHSFASAGTGSAPSLFGFDANNYARFDSNADTGIGTDDEFVSIDVVCPFSDISVSFSIEVTAIFTGTAASALARITQYDSAGASGTQSTVSLGSTGVKTIAITSPDADVYKYTIDIFYLTDISVDGSIFLAQPTLTFAT